MNVAIIARKECLEMSRDGRFRAAGAAILALLALSLLLGMRQYKENRERHAAAQRLTREQWLNQVPKNAHSGAHFGIYAFRPVMPLSLIDPGIDRYTGVAIPLVAHVQQDFKYRPAQDATAAQRFGELTVSTVLQHLVPLLIVMLGFSAAAKEREEGMLRQLVSLGISNRELAVGKFAGLAILLFLLLGGAALIGVAAAWLAGGVVVADLLTPRAALLALSYTVYFATFLGIAIGMSRKASSPGIALVSLIAFWLASSFVAPRMFAEAGRWLFPVPSAESFARNVAADLANGIDGHNSSDKRAARLREMTLQAYGVSREADLPINFEGIALQAAEEYETVVYDQHFRNLRNAYQHQNSVQLAASIVSPFAALRELSMALAGTDIDHDEQFAMSAEKYRRELVRTMNNEIIHGGHDAVGEGPTRGEWAVAKPGTWQKIEDFSYSPPSAWWALQRHRTPAALLLAWFAAGIALLVWRI
jgi:ABC-2 type transport system permease protein